MNDKDLDKMISVLEILARRLYFCETVTPQEHEALAQATEFVRDAENQLTLRYEEGFHDGYRQAMSEADPCWDCQEFSCDECRFKDRRRAGVCRMGL